MKKIPIVFLPHQHASTTPKLRHPQGHKSQTSTTLHKITFSELRSSISNSLSFYHKKILLILNMHGLLAVGQLVVRKNLLLVRLGQIMLGQVRLVRLGFFFFYGELSQSRSTQHHHGMRPSMNPAELLKKMEWSQLQMSVLHPVNSDGSLEQ